MPWAKGESGNPGGRAKAARDVDVVLRAALPQRVRELEALCASSNLTTRFRALELWLSYALGKPRQAVEVTGADGGPIETADVTGLRARLLARAATLHALDSEDSSGAGEPH